MTLAQAADHIGDTVTYLLPWSGVAPVDGVITSVNNYLVFVRFGDVAWSKGCYARDLTLHKGEP